jgi:NADPH:quinone reductase
MRAVGVNTYGGPEALELVELPDPIAAPGQILIRVHAAAVNPTDTYVRNGARAEIQRKDPWPYVPGMDAAGVVAAIGPDTVTDLKVGDAVMAIVLPSGSHGGYSEYLALPARSVTRTPAGSTFGEAASLPMNGLTAQLTLDLLDLAPGATLAVTGAAGAYGGYVVQLAVAAGLRVIADASEADRALVESLGADVVVARGPDVADRIVEHCPGGVDAVADGSVQNEQLFPCVRDGGGFATVRGFTADAPRHITIHPVWVRSYIEAWEKLDRLRELAEAGQISLRVAATFPAERASEAHALLEAGGVRGRLIIEFSASSGLL